MDHAWDMPPLHNPLNVSLLEMTYKLHVCLKAHIVLMTSMVPKMPREVSDERNGGRLKHGLSPSGRAKLEKYSKTNLRLSLPKTHHLFAVAGRTPNTTRSKEGRSPPMVGKMRSSISGSPMMAPNSSIVGHSSIPLKRNTC